MAKKESVVKKDTKKTKKTAKVVKKQETVVVEEPKTEYVKETIPEDAEEFKKQILTNVVSNMVAEEGEGILGNLNEEHREEIIEKVKERIENIKSVNNDKVRNRIDNVFGYLWNGQEMDY